VLGGAKVDDSQKFAENVLINGCADRDLVTGVLQMFACSICVDIGKVNMDFIESQGYTDQIEKGKEVLKEFNVKVGLPYMYSEREW
jgi:phosphoglycerate kinase